MTKNKKEKQEKQSQSEELSNVQLGFGCITLVIIGATVFTGGYYALSREVCNQDGCQRKLYPWASSVVRIVKLIL